MLAPIRPSPIIPSCMMFSSMGMGNAVKRWLSNLSPPPSDVQG